MIITFTVPADAPGRVKVDKVKKDNVALSWKKPVDDGGAPITDYVVEARKISPSGHKGDWEPVRHLNFG